jgi:hypothetical protein
MGASKHITHITRIFCARRLLELCLAGIENKDLGTTFVEIIFATLQTEIFDLVVVENTKCRRKKFIGIFCFALS